MFGWDATDRAIIVHTADSGRTWQMQGEPSALITQVNRIDALGANVWIADADK